MKVCLTGCNRGIGLELARIYSQQGHQILAIVRQSSPELDQLAGTEIQTEVELKTQEGLSRAAKRISIFSPDIFIQCAGILRRSSLEDFPIEEVKEQFLVNTLAPIVLAQEVHSSLKPGSKIAVLTSRMGSITDNGSGGSYGYRMSKAALNAGLKSLAIDLKEREILVGILHPGWVQTEMTGHTGNVSPEESATQLAELIDKLDGERSGRFFHANGEELPW